METWRAIPSLPSHLASSEGRIMRLPFSGTMPHGGPRSYGGEPTKGVLVDGRYQITVKGRTIRVHRLICEAFAGPAPHSRAVVMHLDENSTNNAADNLAWGTQKENLAAPGFRAYLRRRGFSGPKINEDQARVIKYGAGSGAEIASRFGISPATVSNIRCGRAWKHI